MAFAISPSQQDEILAMIRGNLPEGYELLKGLSIRIEMEIFCGGEPKDGVPDINSKIVEEIVLE